MTELRSDTQALLARAREAGGISGEDRSRLKTAIFAQVTAVSVMTTAGAAAATSTGGAAKLVAIGVVLGALGAGGAMLSLESRRPSEESAPSPSAVGSALPKTPSPAFVAPAPPVTLAQEPAVNAAPSPATPPVQVAPRYVAPRSSRVEALAPAESEPASPSASASPSPARAASSEALAQGSITEEARLLREANRTLKGGDAEGALAILALHAQRYPHGVLEPERSAVRVFALCEAGRREDARAAADAFLANHGASPLGARVEGACSAAKGDP